MFTRIIMLNFVCITFFFYFCMILVNLHFCVFVMEAGFGFGSCSRLVRNADNNFSAALLYGIIVVTLITSRTLVVIKKKRVKCCYMIIFQETRLRQSQNFFQETKLQSTPLYQSESLAAASPATVDNKVAKGVKSVSFKETKGHEKKSSAADEADTIPLFSPVLEKLFDDDSFKAVKRDQVLQMPPFYHSQLYGGLNPHMQSQGTTPRLHNHHAPANSHEKSDNLAAASATVDNEVAKGAKAAKSVSFKDTKVQSASLYKEQEKHSRRLVMKCNKQPESIESGGKHDKPVVVTTRKIPRVVPVVRSLPTLIRKDVKPIESGRHHQGHEKRSSRVMEDKKSSESIDSRTKVDKKFASADAKVVRPTITPEDGKSIKYAKVVQSRRSVMECKKKPESIKSRGKHDKPVVVTTRKIPRVVPVVRSLPTLIRKDVKPIESGRHHQGHEKRSSRVMEDKKNSENIDSRTKVDKKFASADAKVVRPTITPEDGKSIKYAKVVQSRRSVMECKKKPESIKSRGKHDKPVVVTTRKIPRVVPVVRSLPTLIRKDVKPIESGRHHQGHEKRSSRVMEDKKSSENIDSRTKVDKKSADAKVVRPTITLCIPKRNVSSLSSKP